MGATGRSRLSPSMCAPHPAGANRWNVAELDRSVLDTETEAFQPGADRPGSGGSASWVFRARKAGSTRLELIKSRKWEGHKDSDQRFSVHITVEAS